MSVSLDAILVLAPAIPACKAITLASSAAIRVFDPATPVSTLVKSVTVKILPVVPPESISQ